MFYFMRHGETLSNRLHKIVGGEIDESLIDEAKEAIREMARSINFLSPKPDVICHSGMARAKETAQILADLLNLKVVERECFRERLLGEWSGKPSISIIHRPDYWQRPAGGESIVDVANRIRPGISEFQHLGECPLLIAHGGVWQALAVLYGKRFSTWPKNGALYAFNDTFQEGFPWSIRQLKTSAPNSEYEAVYAVDIGSVQS